MALDLKFDHNINGHEFKAGDNVNTKANDIDADGKTIENDYSDTLKQQEAAYAEQQDFAHEHHGAVQANDDPNEVTEQTPTRPLADGPDASDPKKGKK